MARAYVLWSFDHQQWWRPDRRGYTPNLAEAGRYTAQEAGEEVTGDIVGDTVAVHERTAELQGKPTVKGLWQ